MVTTRQFKIQTVDDHPIVREGIAAIIRSEKDMLTVGEAANDWEASDMFRSKRLDVALMDLQMPGLNGIDAITTIRQEYPQVRIIVLTTCEGDAFARRALKAGATVHVKRHDSNGVARGDSRSSARIEVYTAENRG